MAASKHLHTVQVAAGMRHTEQLPLHRRMEAVVVLRRQPVLAATKDSAPLDTHAAWPDLDEIHCMPLAVL